MDIQKRSHALMKRFDLLTHAQAEYLRRAGHCAKERIAIVRQMKSILDDRLDIPAIVRMELCHFIERKADDIRDPGDKP